MKANKFESNLIGVSKPYDIYVGDRVRNIDCDCPNYKTTGEVIAVDNDGNITYQLDAQGSTFTTNDIAKKPWDKVMRIFTHTPVSGYGSFGNELHAIAHRTDKENGKIVCWIQKIGLIQSRKMHGLHHTSPYEINYCVMTNYCNPILNFIGFWNKLEKLISIFTKR